MKINLNEWKADKRKNALEIETDGETFFIDPPQLWPDSAQTLAKAGDNEGTLRAIMGSDNYDRYIAAGGVSAVILEAIPEWTGVPLGGSSASSES